MRVDLPAYLDSIDSHLAGYRSPDDGISTGALRRVQCYAVALVEGLVIPEHVHEDWLDFFPLVVAFVLAYGSPRLGHLARRSTIFEGGGDDPLTDGDRLFLVTLVAECHDHLSRRGR